MRERDMRLRVERFIQTRLRSMVMPATLGLGMAIGGCNSDGLNADDGGSEDAVANTGTGGAQGSGGTGGAQGSGGAQGTGGVTGSGGAMGSGGTTSPATKYIAPVPMYIAAIPDAGPEVSMPAPEYIAPVVKQDAGIAVRYMAQMPADASDPGTPVALYLAQLPSK
jgi:hypothetical protein